jgi:hypothetical protein
MTARFPGFSEIRAVIEDVNELGVPLPPDIGGVAATSRRSREASFNGAGGREARAR